MKRLLLLTLTLSASAALADEGMWTFDNFPKDKVKKAYGFEPDQAWLDKVRLSSARLAGGCSASFVSPNGLVLTNHHCARGCVADLSTAKQDYMKNGFHARTQAAEKVCPNFEINKLVEIRDITDKVNAATKGLSGEKYVAAQKAIAASEEKACATSPDVRCDLVSLYQGGRYHLYKYQRFQDVRLVFAPETDIGFFGGDPDNFEFPRYALDFAFLRVYQDGKPAKTDPYFKWSQTGAKDKELVFISGNPGTTLRLQTIAQMANARDRSLPATLQSLAEMRGALDQYATLGKEQDRTSQGLRFGLDNSYKALRGRQEALVDHDFFNKLVKQENDLRMKVNADPEMKQQYGAAWGEIERAVKRGNELATLVGYTNGGPRSRLFGYARTLAEAAEETVKPDTERLPAYTDARRPSLEARLSASAPVHPAVEEIVIRIWLTNLRAELGPDHELTKSLLGNESPASLAKALVSGTKLSQPALRKQLLAGGQKAIDASKDPMIRFVAKILPLATKVRKQYETEVSSVIDRNEELIAKARFAVYGTSTYPDATFSPRLSYGSVKGWVEDGKTIAPFTNLAGTYDRATGKEPFALPPSWIKAKSKIKGEVPFNFVTNNDIIGGNSGSPMINQNAELVGLVFDGNIHSLGGAYGFDEKLNRSVGVHSAGMAETLRSVYGATELLQELGLPTK